MIERRAAFRSGLLRLVQSRFWRFLAVGLILFCVFVAEPVAGLAQVTKEYQVKAVCLWRLAQFVTWPAEAFENEDSPIVIGVLGQNPFGGLLETAVNRETAHGRKLVVQYYREAGEAKACHILYLTASDAVQVKKAVAQLAGRSILTVSDIDGFTMVRFRTEQNKIRLRIDRKAALAARLVLDSRLLRAAEIVESH